MVDDWPDFSEILNLFDGLTAFNLKRLLVLLGLSCAFS